MDEEGAPLAIIKKGIRRRVAQVMDTWRIDDEWWRQEVSRRYFLLELEGSVCLTVFRDLLGGKWYEQR